MDAIDSRDAALVVIDLQKGIVSAQRPFGPHAADLVVENAAKLADACRKRDIPVFLVHVQSSPATMLKPEADAPMGFRDLPKDWAEFVPELGPKPGDVIITKQQWGAFYGTDLDLQLRRRNRNTVILCGISTNIGVESTARFAYEYGYAQVFAEDAMTAMDAQAHAVSVEAIFKRMGRVRSTGEIIGALSKKN